MKTAIIGAGYAGLTAAYVLGLAGHRVTLYEALPRPGGLAAGFKAPGWEWPLEKFYHHLFASDSAIIGLCNELGIGDALTVYRPSTDLIHEGKPYPYDGPLAALKYPGFSLLETARAALSIAYLKLRNDWRPFETITAHEWMQRAMGGAYEKQFGPLLRGKFGEENYREVPMTWLWARFHARTQRLIYPDGGFETITAAMVRAVEAQGASILLSTPVRSLRAEASGWIVDSQHGGEHYDSVIATVSPKLLARLVPDLPESYLASLTGLKSMGAVVMTVALSRKLTERSYWLNLNKDEFPMLSLVEHTNMVDPRHYGGDHLIYMGDYLDATHPYLSYSAEQLFEVYEPSLRTLNAEYDRSWVRDMWIFSTPYAQPIPSLRHSERIPALRTPLPGLYLASMSQVYPWDRGTNFAVDMGQKVARVLLADKRTIEERLVEPA